jgi:DNA-directed RNA polymerase subunit L
VSQCSYENTLDSNPDRQKEMFERWVKENKKIEEDADPGSMAMFRREYDTMEVKRCFLVNELGEPNDFTFTIESKGIQSVPAIVHAGIIACKARVAKYRDIDTMIPANVTFRRGNTRYSSVECVFQHESHKIGNILQTYLTYNHIEGSKEPQISYVGYKVPHPLRPEMVLTIAVPASETSDLEIEIGMARYAVAQVCRYLVDFFQSMADQWSASTGYVPPTPIETSKPVVETVEAPKAIVAPVEVPKPVVETVEAPKAVVAPVEVPKPVVETVEAPKAVVETVEAPKETPTPVEAPKEEILPVEAPTATKVKRTKKITSVAK